MITQEQRRALFALREALRLCDEAGILIRAREEKRLGEDLQQELAVGEAYHYSHDSFLGPETVSAILEEHPEP